MTKKNINKVIVFSIPILIYVLLIVMIDPFDYFSKNNFIPENVKAEISPVINECLWKIIDFNRKPEPSVLMGDSRMALVNKDTVLKRYKRKFYNLSYASASLKEIINSFWFIVGKGRIDTVLIGISLEKYNQTFVRDRIDGAISVLTNPLLYFSNYNVPQASYLCLKELFAKSQVSLNNPGMTNDEFWKYQIEVSGKKYYSSYKYSQFYFSELQKIASFCASNKISLIFIIFPVHKDLQDLVGFYKLETEYQTFIHDLSTFGEVIDFCFANTITADKGYFNDPFHIRSDIFNQYYLPRLFPENKIFITDSLTRFYPEGVAVFQN